LALVLGGMIARTPLAPLNTRSTPAELGSVVEATGASRLICDEASKAVAETVAVGVAVMPELREEEVPRLRAGRDETVLVLHTSGTTGLPKPVRFSESVMEARAPIFTAAVGLSAGDRYVSPALFHHIAGLAAHLAVLRSGGSVIPMPRFDLATWAETLELAPTHALLVPTMFEMLLDAEAVDAGPRVFIYGAAPIRPQTLRRMLEQLPGTEFVQLFGQTEGSPLTVLAHADHLRALDGDEALLRSVGRPIEQVEIQIVEPDESGTGEIVARGPHLAGASSDGWLHTGDLGEMVEGYVYLRGRQSDKIIRGAENIFPLEIERILDAHPGVAEAAVVGAPDDRLGEVPVAFVVVADADGVDVAVLESHLRERLAPFKIPVAWTFVDQLPRNAAGKVLRRELVAG
jgi:acyl-CoA synthetase (AMP-forming)/AMP-acid ligase II